MEPTKFVGLSRAAWGCWAPTAAVAVNQTGALAGLGKAEPWVELGMTLLGLLSWALHQRSPDPRRPVLRPTRAIQNLAALLAACAILPLALPTGCAGEQGPVITAEQCTALVEIAKVAFAECENVGSPDDPDRAAKVERCYRYAEAGAQVAVIACGFIPPTPPNGAPGG